MENDAMKRTIVGAAVISAMVASTTAPAFAGSLAEPDIENELIVIDQAPEGAINPGLVIGALAGIALLAVIVSSDDDT
jgi:hypothetical protein